MFCIPVSTGALKGDKSLKMSSDSISEGVIFQNFLGGMPPDPPSIGMFRMPVCSAHYDSVYPGYPHINNDDTSGCAPPLSKVWIRP